MVWTPPRANPITHLRSGDTMLCGASISRCYTARNGDAPTCRKCATLTAKTEKAK